MPGSTRKGWRTPPRWLGGLTAYVDRRMDRVAGGSQRSLEITEGWMEKAMRRYGPDSWKTVNVMEATAKRKDQVGDHEGALPLRRVVVAKRREHLGPEHPLVVSAEFALSGTLVSLGRTDEARPLVEHVLVRRMAELGPDDPASLAALERSGRIDLTLGETAQGMVKYDRAIAGYQAREDRDGAIRCATNLGRILLGDGHNQEALDVFRELVDLQSRTLGPDAPATLRSRRDLALALARMGRLFEAKVIADGLVVTSARVLGPDHEATRDAAELLAKIDDALPPR